jgi:hypothetical protein
MRDDWFTEKEDKAEWGSRGGPIKGKWEIIKEF